MSNARKLQTEIDRVMKKVDEGVELFDEIWEKVYSASNQSQKEKYEMDLKKEIKKLQRLRDQIKSWIGGNEVKDKEPLIDARKLIETKMEAFKTCEKETKTKTYSKEGLMRAEQLSPEEEAKKATSDWISEIIDRLNKLVEDAEVEVEKLQVGKGKKTNRHLIDEANHFIGMHKYHLNKLEGIMRLVNNDVLDVEVVDPIKDDLDYYLDSYEDDDYQQAYDEEFFYEALGLDDLQVVNVDRVTNVKEDKKKDTDEVSKSSKGSKDTKKSKKSAASTMIPLTIGRARASKAGKADKGSNHHRDSSTGASDDENSTGPNSVTPTKAKRASSVTSMPTPTTIPAAKTPAPGASMAAILKRESEAQEKERQAKAAEALRQQQQAAALLKQQQAEQLRQQQQQEALRQQQQDAAAKQQQQLQEQQAAALRQQQEAALRQQQSAQDPKAPSASSSVSGAIGSGANTSSSTAGGANPSAGLDIISGLGGLSLNGNGAAGAVGSGGAIGGGDPVAAAAALGTSNVMLQESFATLPTANEQDRTRPYTPQNPYPGMPPSYPSTPSTLFENPAVFEKLGTDALFFIFYYKQGTYQQYLAARELKKQSWRFHKKYMTWFQRHEEPKVTTDEYEQGTYVYFDYETGWCTRIKQDFRFEYSFLEDSLQ